MEHRFAVVLRFPCAAGKGRCRYYGYRPSERGETSGQSYTDVLRRQKKVAKIIEKLIKAVTEIIRNQDTANFILLRGFSQAPDIPHFEEVYGLKSVAIATYPMYRGLQNSSAWTPLL